MASTLSEQHAAVPPPSAISETLAQVTKRLRLARWLRHASRGALAGLCAAFPAVALAHFDLLPDWLPLEAALPVSLLLGAAAGTLTAFLRPISLMDAARLAEARLGLKERLSSALEFEQSAQSLDPEAAALRRLQLEDASAHARRLKVSEAVPLRLPWEAKVLAAGLVLLALTLAVPALPIFVPPGLRVERQIVRKAGSKLEQTAGRMQKQADLGHLAGTQRAAAAMQRLAQRLATGHLDKKQALVQMSTLTRQMRRDLEKAAQAGSAAGTGGKSMAQAGQQLAAALAGGSKDRLKNGQKSGKDDAATPEVQKAAQAMAQNDSAGLSNQFRQMAERVQSGTLSPAAQRRAASDTQKLADALQNTPMPQTQAQAQAAAAALKRGDRQSAASELRKAAESAAREAHDQADTQGQQAAKQSVEDAASEMAGASRAGDIQDDRGQPGSGRGKPPGRGNGHGPGNGQKMLGATGKHGNGGSGGGKVGGTSDNTGEGSRPLKHLGTAPALNPKAVNLYFGKPVNSGPSKDGPIRKIGADPNAAPDSTASQVPYYSYVAPAQKSAESAMDKEDIPPAYRSDVRKYFNSLNPPVAGR